MSDKEETPTKPVGRPLLFESVEELDRKIDEYINSCAPQIVKTQVKRMKADGTEYWAESETIRDQQPLTVSGLAYHLGCDRKTLLNYKERPEFFPSIERALTACEKYAESQLFIGKNANGASFALKNNYGWEDKSTHEVDGKGGFFNAPKLVIEVIRPKQQPDEEEINATVGDTTTSV
jgi:hypothetical protein